MLTQDRKELVLTRGASRAACPGLRQLCTGKGIACSAVGLVLMGGAFTLDPEKGRPVGGGPQLSGWLSTLPV